MKYPMPELVGKTRRQLDGIINAGAEMMKTHGVDRHCSDDVCTEAYGTRAFREIEGSLIPTELVFQPADWLDADWLDDVMAEPCEPYVHVPPTPRPEPIYLGKVEFTGNTNLKGASIYLCCDGYVTWNDGGCQGRFDSVFDYQEPFAFNPELNGGDWCNLWVRTVRHGMTQALWNEWVRCSEKPAAFRDNRNTPLSNWYRTFNPYPRRRSPCHRGEKR